MHECKVVEECEFFKWYVDGGNYGRGTFTKEKVDAVLRKHACGLKEGVQKGIYNFFAEKHICQFNIIIFNLICFYLKVYFLFILKYCSQMPYRDS